MNKIKILLISILLASAFGLTSKSYAQNSKALLYFVEQYKDGEEIGKSDRFTTGYLTVMVDTRPAGKTLGTSKVDIVISKIKDENGNSVSEKIVNTVPFDVQADWDYIFFEDQENLVFSLPGTYKVICQKKNGSKIAEGNIEIVSK